MTVRIIGPTCVEEGCNRPVWDQDTGLCSCCWRLKRVTGEVPESVSECERIWEAS